MEFIFRCRTREVERQPDRRESDSCISIDAQCSTKVKVAFRTDETVDLKAAVGSDGPKRHTSTSHQRLEQHVSRTSETAVAPCGGVKTGLDYCPTSRHRTAHFFAPEMALCLQGDHRCRRVLAIASLQRSLELFQFLSIQCVSP